MDKELSEMRKREFSYLYLVQKLAPYLNALDPSVLIHATVSLRVDHCGTLYMGVK